MEKAQQGPPGAEPPPLPAQPGPTAGPDSPNTGGAAGAARGDHPRNRPERGPEPAAAPAAPLPDGCERRPAAAPAPPAPHLLLPGPGWASRPGSVPHAPARPSPRYPIAATAAQRAPAHPLLLPRQARPLGPPPRAQPITARRRHRCAALLAINAATYERIRGFPAHRACMSRRGGGGWRNAPSGAR